MLSSVLLTALAFGALSGAVAPRPSDTDADDMAGNWSAIAPMSIGRQGAGVTALDGRIFAIAGFCGFQYLASAEAYSPRNDTWSPIAPVSVARVGVSACALDGAIYAVGGYDGHNLAIAERYDPPSDTWSIVAPMSVGRIGVGLGALGGKLYAISGAHGTGASTGIIFDPRMFVLEED